MAQSKAQKTSTDFLCLTISAGSGKQYTDERGLVRNAYRVRLASDATGARVSFMFCDSAARCSQGVDQLDRENLLTAFWSFVSDAQAGEMAFDEFAGEFGYDVDSISARRIWTACKASRAKFARLFHDDRDSAWCLDQLAAAGVE